jgi:Domain of Unknown Function with PDB structure (DUF3857)/Transglutaminase-like superfamily
MKMSRALLTSLILTLLAVRGAAAADFPPITPEERALTAVPGEPNAPAVVLFRKGEFLMEGYFSSAVMVLPSYLRVQVRLKVLTEAGKNNGEVILAHNDEERLTRFKGRTVLPDGRVIPVPEDAKFVRRTSRRSLTTAVAFPAVQVGAILDYQYELEFHTIFRLKPWYFSEELPVRYSEIVYRVPTALEVQEWSRAPLREKIQRRVDRNARGYVTTAWAENLPALPDEPYGPPFADLAAQMILLPSASKGRLVHISLLESWEAACALLGTDYGELLRHDRAVQERTLAVAGPGSPGDKARALYRFVRDQIENNEFIGVAVDPERQLDQVLAERKGSRAEKALLLFRMLKIAGIDSKLVWAADRGLGAIDLQLPNPSWFDTMLVRVDLDGKPVFLDPSDRALGFGHLRPGYEGTPALISDLKNPERIVLPTTPYEQSLRRAVLDLTLDGKGRITGTGTLSLTGHPAWEHIVQEDPARSRQAWAEWLEKRFRDYRISDVKADASADEEKVTVTWALAQRGDEALGDETTLAPSPPLGPLTQPLVQPAASRRTGVYFDYPWREEVELRLRWPESWKVQAMPQEKTVAGAAGSLAVQIETRPDERSLVYTRRVDVPRRAFESSRQYEAIRSLFGDVEKSDAQKLVLVRR